jgi:Flp pilus assembly pilin Flp
MFNRMSEYLRVLTLSAPRGQGLAEYALILALIAIVAVVALVFLSNSLSSILSTVGKKL